eukprot:gene6740-12302_t
MLPCTGAWWTGTSDAKEGIKIGTGDQQGMETARLFMGWNPKNQVQKDSGYDFIVFGLGNKSPTSAVPVERSVNSLLFRATKTKQECILGQVLAFLFASKKRRLETLPG